MLVEKENSTPLMEEDKLPNLTGKIKTDENGREYIDNPNSPNGREYVYYLLYVFYNDF